MLGALRSPLRWVPVLTSLDEPQNQALVRFLESAAQLELVPRASLFKNDPGGCQERQGLVVGIATLIRVNIIVSG